MKRINIVNEGEKFNKKKYEGALGDYDKDGLANIDDANPYTSEKNPQKVEQIELAKTFEKLLTLKNQLDDTMDVTIGELDTIAPKGSLIYARTKTPYSILKKLVEKRLTDKQRGLTDLVGTTIVVDDLKDLRKVDKAIKKGDIGKVVEREDMYKNPKGGYRAIHYLVEVDGYTVEVQLKTKRQKAINEESHEPYKKGTLNAEYLLFVTDLANKADKGNRQAYIEFDKIIDNPTQLAKDLDTSFEFGGEIARSYDVNINSGVGTYAKGGEVEYKFDGVFKIYGNLYNKWNDREIQEFLKSLKSLEIIGDINNVLTIRLNDKDTKSFKKWVNANFYAKGGEVEEEYEDIRVRRLWNERGYNDNHLGSLSEKELQRLYDTEFYFEDNEFEYAKGGKISQDDKDRVLDNIDKEGINYGIREYDEYTDIKDNEFQKLRKDYIVRAKQLERQAKKDEYYKNLVDNEGLDYAFTEYIDFEEVKDQELKSKIRAYDKAKDRLLDYLGTRSKVEQIEYLKNDEILTPLMTGIGMYAKGGELMDADTQVDYANGGSVSFADFNPSYPFAKGGWIQDATAEMEKKGTIGAFTAKAKRYGMTPQEFAKKVLADDGKTNYTLKTKRQAQFMKNANPEMFSDGGEINRSYDVNINSGVGTYATGGVTEAGDTDFPSELLNYAKGGEVDTQTITIKFKDNSDALSGKQLLEDYYIDFGDITNYGTELDVVVPTNESFEYREYIRAALKGTQEKIEISSFAKGGKMDKGNREIGMTQKLKMVEKEARSIEPYPRNDKEAERAYRIAYKRVMGEEMLAKGGYLEGKTYYIVNYYSSVSDIPKGIPLKNKSFDTKEVANTFLKSIENKGGKGFITDFKKPTQDEISKLDRDRNENYMMAKGGKINDVSQELYGMNLNEIDGEGIDDVRKLKAIIFELNNRLEEEIGILPFDSEAQGFDKDGNPYGYDNLPFAKGGDVSKGIVRNQEENYLLRLAIGYSMKKFRDEDDRDILNKIYDRLKASKSYAKGGKTQGYNSRLDESLAERDGAERGFEQKKKDRRDESKAMEKAKGKRAYSSVKSMDKPSMSFSFTDDFFKDMSSAPKPMKRKKRKK